MQFSADGVASADVDGVFITFKSSPNFRNMKKFLKTRMGESELSPITDYMESPPQQEEIQPPLPLQPPPPDNPPPPPDLAIPLKSEQPLLQPKKECVSPGPEIKSEVVEEPKAAKQMCKDFVRGACFRVRCVHQHEIILSQLPGIFNFCHQFQNSVCKKPNCRFVHASIFEERKFYRTGELPKALQPKSEAAQPTNVNGETQKFMLPPPPPPPPKPVVHPELVKESIGGNGFINNMSQPPPHFIKPRPEEQLKIAQAPSFNHGIGDLHRMDTQRNGNKRGWPDNNEGHSRSSPPDDESRAKRCNNAKCSTCKVMENRYNFALKRLEKVLKSSQETELKRLQLEKKHKFLLTLVSIMFSSSSKQSAMTQTQTEVQQLLQQSTESLNQLREDWDKTAQQTTKYERQLKQLMQSPNLINKANIKNIYTEPKAFQLSPQQMMHLQPPPNGNGGMYQLQSNSAGTMPTESTPIRFNNMEGSSRQVSNLLNGW